MENLQIYYFIKHARLKLSLRSQMLTITISIHITQQPAQDRMAENQPTGCLSRLNENGNGMGESETELKISFKQCGYFRLETDLM